MCANEYFICVYLYSGFSTVVLCKSNAGTIIVGVSPSIQHWVVVLLYEALYCCDVVWSCLVSTLW